MKNRVLSLGGVVFLALVLLLGPGNARTLAPVPDPERESAALTSWWWYHDVSPEFLAGELQSKGARIIDLEVHSASSFSAVLVKNSGTYARTWWWYYGLTADELSAKLSSLDARIVDLEPYYVSGNLRFAAALVKNTGDGAKTWWWYYGQTADDLGSKLAQNEARLIDLDAYPSGRSTRYAGVMIKNAGVDSRAWWWYVSATPTFISEKLTENKARLIGMEPDGSGRFDVIMVRGAGEYWWWYYGVSADQLGAYAAQNGARIVDLEPYSSGGRKYAAVLVNDLDAESTRIRDYVSAGWAGGSFGFYLKKVGGGVSAALNADTIFEPASTIKALIGVYSMRRVQDGLDSLGSSIAYYTKPGDTTNKDVCPDPAWESDAANKVTTTVRDALKRMLQPSDNRTTRSLTLRYGQETINGYALNTVGMTKTKLRQIIGCGLNNNLRNDLTLVDAGKLYEGVSNGTLLNSTYRGYLFDGSDVSPADNIMLRADGSYYGAIVQQEAAALGKSAAASQFTANMVFHWKGGSYGFGVADTTQAYRVILTEAGVMTLPYKRAGKIVPTDFVYGRWVDVRINCGGQAAGETTAQFYARCPQAKGVNDTVNTANFELFRAQIRAALKTW